MALVSMKVPSEPEEYAPNPYGYGLCICLTEEQVEALGLNVNPPAAGSSVGLRAVATVRRVTQEADLDQDADGVDVVLELQITDLEVTPGATSMSQSANLLYSGDND